MNLTVREIVKKYLQENGYDGLYFDDGDEKCGCALDDFEPCCEMWQECQAAYKHSDDFFRLEKEVKDD